MSIDYVKLEKCIAQAHYKEFVYVFGQNGFLRKFQCKSYHFKVNVNATKTISFLLFEFDSRCKTSIYAPEDIFLHTYLFYCNFYFVLLISLYTIFIWPQELTLAICNRAVSDERKSRYSNTYGIASRYSLV